MIWEYWVLDATMGWPPCFCPIEGDPAGEFNIVTGFNLIGSKPDGKVFAIVHADGQDAADAFYAEHEAEIKTMLGAT